MQNREFFVEYVGKVHLSGFDIVTSNASTYKGTDSKPFMREHAIYMTLQTLGLVSPMTPEGLAKENIDELFTTAGSGGRSRTRLVVSKSQASPYNAGRLLREAMRASDAEIYTYHGDDGRMAWIGFTTTQANSRLVMQAAGFAKASTHHTGMALDSNTAWFNAEI